MDREDKKRSMIRRLDSIPHCRRALEDFKQGTDVIHLREILPTDWLEGAGGRKVLYDICPGERNTRPNLLWRSGVCVCVCVEEGAVWTKSRGF